ncbi:MAG: metalloregulator ArsR/SmtB family transcription factor [Psychromonas sp.]
MSKLALIHEKSKEVSELLKLIAHADRMVVLCLLAEGEQPVSELREHTKLSQSAFSQHLGVLRKNDLVKVRKEAQQVFYSIADPRVKVLLGALQQAFCPPE